MDAAHEEGVRQVVVMKSAQVGWTEILNNTVGYYMEADPSPTLMLQPTLEMAEAWSKDRLSPMLRDTPCLRDAVADPRARDSGNTLLHKRFTGGHLTVVGANSPAGLASRPIRVLLCDEVDRFPSSAGTEGDPISLAIKRTATFSTRKILMGSTPTIKGSSRIESAFGESDQRYYLVPCPHCGEAQRLVWANVRWPEGQPERAVYVCTHCGVELVDGDKPGMLAAGRWQASRTFDGIAGFHVSELYSPWVTWGEMAVAFVSAKRLPETLQTWVNTALGETWEDRGEQVEPQGLMARREGYGAGSLPPGVLVLTMGVDVQDNRLEAFVYGWGVDEEAWLVEHRMLRGDPGQGQVWAELDEMLRHRYPTDDGRRLLIEATCVDSGGHYTQHVYRYCSARKRFRVWAIKGMAGPGRLAWPKRATRVAANRADLFVLGVDTIKSVLYGRLQKIAAPGPGYVHFPQEIDDEFFAQLTSETRVYKTVQGRRVPVWRPKSANLRQEGLDGTVYAYAAMVGRGGPDVLAARASARELEDDAKGDYTLPEVAAEPSPPHSPPDRPAGSRRPQRRGGGYVKQGRF